LLVFHIDERRYALHLACVLRVLPMLDMAPLPGAPSIVKGIVNVAGKITPVMDLRRRFELPAREAQLSDVLVLARTQGATVALPADEVSGVLMHAPADVTPAQAVASGSPHIEGILKLHDGLVLIHDLDTFLSLPERTQLGRALDAEEEGV
jgi:purine-binding chemotaxis protein CheW